MSRKLVYLALFVLIAVVGVASGLSARVAGDWSGQQSSSAPRSTEGDSSQTELVRLSAPAKTVPDVAGAPAPGSVFGLAAARNTTLESGLPWTFGGRPQTGWKLYIPIISQLIGFEGSVGSSDFASSIAEWQRKNGLKPTGMLEDTTWYGMIQLLQSRRIRDRQYPSADQLVSIESDELFDPTRPEHLRKAERHAYSAYKRMVAAAAADETLGLKLSPDGRLAADEKYLKIISAHRSREYQDYLRKQSPKAGRAGLAVNSPHFTGRAFDIYVGGDPVDTKYENRLIQTETAVYRWLVRNAARFGFRPYFYEPWHWEYVGRQK